jgi:hypothetical protein
MILYRVNIPKQSTYAAVDGKYYDAVWVEANNPNTAVLDAIRWYDLFIGKRDRTAREKPAAFMAPPTVRLSPDEIRLHQYNVWYAVDGFKKLDKIAVFAYGRNKDDAVRIALEYGRYGVSRHHVTGLSYVERAAD